MDVRSVDGIEAATDLSDSGLTSVHVEVTECYPAKDAGKLLKVLQEKVNSGSWFVSAETLTQLQDLSDACENLKEADGEIVKIIDGATSDLSIQGDADPLDKKSRRAIVSRALGLPSGSKPPRRFTSENYQLVSDAYDRLREQMFHARVDLESTRTHLRDVWRPWAEERLNARVSLGEPFFDS